MKLVLTFNKGVLVQKDKLPFCPQMYSLSFLIQASSNVDISEAAHYRGEEKDAASQARGMILLS